MRHTDPPESAWAEAGPMLAAGVFASAGLFLLISGAAVGQEAPAAEPFDTTRIAPGRRAIDTSRDPRDHAAPVFPEWGPRQQSPSPPRAVVTVPAEPTRAPPAALELARPAQPPAEPPPWSAEAIMRAQQQRPAAPGFQPSTGRRVEPPGHPPLR
jgi:hypothetical protein